MPLRPIEPACLPRLAALYQPFDSFASEAGLPLVFHCHRFLTCDSAFVMDDAKRTILFGPLSTPTPAMFVPSFEELFGVADVNAAVCTQDRVDVEWTFWHRRRLVHHTARDLVFLQHDSDGCGSVDAWAA